MVHMIYRDVTEVWCVDPMGSGGMECRNLHSLKTARERKRDRQIDRQTGRQTGKQADKEAWTRWAAGVSSAGTCTWCASISRP
jgi:hypothetical protein